LSPALRHPTVLFVWFVVQDSFGAGAPSQLTGRRHPSSDPLRGGLVIQTQDDPTRACWLGTARASGLPIRPTAFSRHRPACPGDPWTLVSPGELRRSRCGPPKSEIMGGPDKPGHDEQGRAQL